MIKICSLEFLNRSVFETDIMLEDGYILFEKGQKISPEILLRLYFKNIYVEKWPIETNETKAAQQEYNFDSTFMDTPIEEAIERPIEDPAEIPLEFDEEEAQKVSNYASILAKKINMGEQTVKEVEKAAYYHKIGITKLKTSDLKKPEYKKLLAEASYKLLIKEMNFSEKMAEASRFYRYKYDPTQFNINKGNTSELPYSHIVAIASYYNNLLIKNLSKEEALQKLMQIGGNRFNIFILHKFITAIKKIEDNNEK